MAYLYRLYQISQHKKFQILEEGYEVGFMDMFVFKTFYRHLYNICISFKNVIIDWPSCPARIDRFIEHVRRKGNQT